MTTGGEAAQNSGQHTVSTTPAGLEDAGVASRERLDRPAAPTTPGLSGSPEPADRALTPGTRVRSGDVHGVVTRVEYEPNRGANQQEHVYVQWAPSDADFSPTDLERVAAFQATFRDFDWPFQ